jgi:hypothetical protein
LYRVLDTDLFDHVLQCLEVYLSAIGLSIDRHSEVGGDDVADGAGHAVAQCLQPNQQTAPSAVLHSVSVYVLAKGLEEDGR